MWISVIFIIWKCSIFYGIESKEHASNPLSLKPGHATSHARDGSVWPINWIRCCSGWCFAKFKASTNVWRIQWWYSTNSMLFLQMSHHLVCIGTSTTVEKSLFFNQNMANSNNNDILIPIDINIHSLLQWKNTYSALSYIKKGFQWGSYYRGVNYKVIIPMQWGQLWVEQYI